MKTQTETKHTPTPWKYNDDERFSSGRIQAIGREEEICLFRYGANEDKANASFIIRACNSHEELLTQLKYEHNIADIPEHETETCKTCTAIAKAEGR